MARPAASPGRPSAPPSAAWSAELSAWFHGAAAVVILPTLNEEEGLARTLAELQRQRLHGPGRRVEILVIDGGSTDRTLEVAREKGVPALRQVGRGKGAAVVETIDWVHAQGIPHAVVLDADATYPPDRVLDALDLLEQSADLVVGVRRPVRGPPIHFKEMIHRVGNIGLSYTASLLSRRTIFDLCSGFWGVSTERFVSLGLERSYFAIEAEMVLKALRQQLRVVQIPVEYRERVGKAKLHAFRDGSRILLTILRQGLSPYPRSEAPAAETPDLGELLSIGLITGSHGAVLECALSDSAAADRLATVLRRNFPETVVQVEPAGPPIEPSLEPATGPAPMMISVSTDGSSRSGARAVAVSIRSPRRQLTIELPSAGSPSPSKGNGRSPAAVRSGAWAPVRPGPRGAWFPSLDVLTSRLSYDRIDQQRAMLSANGFRVVERARPRRVGLTESSGEA